MTTRLPAGADSRPRLICVVRLASAAALRREWAAGMGVRPGYDQFDLVALVPSHPARPDWLAEELAGVVDRPYALLFEPQTVAIAAARPSRPLLLFLAGLSQPRAVAPAKRLGVPTVAIVASDGARPAASAWDTRDWAGSLTVRTVNIGPDMVVDGAATMLDLVAEEMGLLPSTIPGYGRWEAERVDGEVVE
jgi:hypothetical protein